MSTFHWTQHTPGPPPPHVTAPPPIVLAQGPWYHNGDIIQDPVSKRYHIRKNDNWVLMGSV
jgi:hypothetical protein